MEEIKEGIYYHYCSLETFINILKNKNIRLGNPYKMNDGNEIMLFFEKLKTKMNNHFELLKDEAVRKYFEYVCKCQYKNVGFVENKHVRKMTCLFSTFLVFFC